MAWKRAKLPENYNYPELCCEGNPPVTGGAPYKGPVTLKMFPFDYVIMEYYVRIVFATGLCVDSVFAEIELL